MFPLRAKKMGRQCIHRGTGAARYPHVQCILGGRYHAKPLFFQCEGPSHTCGILSASKMDSIETWRPQRCMGPPVASYEPLGPLKYVSGRRIQNVALTPAAAGGGT